MARISSLLSVAILAMFFIGEGFDIAAVSSSQWAGILFFPLGIVLGFSIAWKWEVVGGLVSIFSLAGFYVVYGVLIASKVPEGFAFMIFTSPALAFVISGLYARFAFGKASVDE